MKTRGHLQATMEATNKKQDMTKTMMILLLNLFPFPWKYTLITMKMLIVPIHWNKNKFTIYFFGSLRNYSTTPKDLNFTPYKTSSHIFEGNPKKIISYLSPYFTYVLFYMIAYTHHILLSPLMHNRLSPPTS